MPEPAYQILLVDDDPNILAGLTRGLRSQGFAVRSVGSGAQALNALAEQATDAIVSDQNMPSMRGIDLLACVASTYPDMVRVMLTGEATLDVAMRAINAGQVQRFLVKPCHALELGHALRQQLEQRALLSGAKRLLTQARRQRSVLERLEASNPGITHIDCDADGAIVLDEELDGQSLLQEIQQLLDAEQSSPSAESGPRSAR